jgi:hypothetical protein
MKKEMRVCVPAAVLVYVFSGLLPVPAQAHGSHAPQHGGVVLSLPDHHVEAILKPDGHYSLYFSDETGDPVPATLASKATLTVLRPGQKAESVPLRLGASGDDWSGSGAPVADRKTIARIAYLFHGMPYSSDILFFSRSTNPLFHIALTTIPGAVRAGRPALLKLQILDSASRPVTDLEIVHERLIHLLVVSQDLYEFYHIHPQLSRNGTFDVSHVFPYGGRYRLYADYTPRGSEGVIESMELNVQGPKRAARRLVLDGAQTKTVGPYRVTLSSNKPLVAGEDVQLDFKVMDAATEKAIHNLQPYLGAWAHLMIVSSDLNQFIHAHPSDPRQTASKPGNPSPSVIQVETGFRQPGLYKVWIQVQRNSVVTAIPFVFQVSGQAEAIAGPAAPPDATLVTVSDSGYEPAKIEAKVGQPLKLAFYRRDAQNCASEVDFPDLHISQHLPPGKTTVVTVVPRKSGVLSFACKMGMFKGQLVVR